MGVGSIYETRTGLSAIVSAICEGSLAEHVITKRGVPAARIVPIAPAVDTSMRVGGKKGKAYVADDAAFDALDADVAALFGM